MIRNEIPVLVAVCSLFVGRASGQQVRGGWRHTTALPAAAGCEDCHTSHGGAKILKGEPPGGGIQAWLQSQAPGAGSPTVACLRCHWTAQERDQANAVAAEPLGSGRFLGPDLADDHLLGATNPRTPRLLVDQTPRTTTSRAISDRDVIECTTCHSPHTEGAAVVRGAARQQLCGGCHPMESQPVDRHRTVPCTGCHQLHGARQPRFLRETTVEQMCDRCHLQEGVPQPSRAFSADSSEDSPLTLTPTHNPGSNCLECHTVHPGR